MPTLDIIGHMYSLYGTTSGNKEADLQGGTVVVSLHSSSYTPNRFTHKYYDVSVTNEISDAAYAAFTLVTPTWTVDGTTGANKLTCATDPIWTGNNTPARYVVYRDNAPGSNKPLICYYDLQQDVIIERLRISASGIIRFNPS